MCFNDNMMVKQFGCFMTAYSSTVLPLAAQSIVLQSNIAITMLPNYMHTISRFQ